MEQTMEALLARAEVAEAELEACATKLERQEQQVEDLCKELEAARVLAGKAKRIVAERQAEHEGLRAKVDCTQQRILALKAKCYDEVILGQWNKEKEAWS